ncbi:MAG TPA: NUDIX domain-containing protein [Candidatus Saccharibacteria bacterium]|nr:NUDIX domain-containing protein [Candidatus Saccharibacteria bacterium]
MSEEIYAKGKLFELVHLPQADGRVFEVARRAPGVRVIIADKTNKRVLLTKEFRKELDAWDYRLPGGKVFDTLEEFEAHRTRRDDILDAAKAKAKAEAAEEAGVVISEVKFIAKSTLGATVEWDLYIFEALDWHEDEQGQALEAGEEIEAGSWYTYDEVERMVLDGSMQEERIALALLRWVKSNV